ncbi:hypothetical protein HOP50_04g29620 [Chloropicon primus]|uniref:WW domain-containing protein n=2 Tax=Chloropicon primus TaxID=1764295 RepID=A0A5B8ML67_9CHLO|nr:hypothetical protein A3770_04p29630 [Chloropicon primus]UPQ99654.1 hypothetical protein HOP50_04g29620 [Chloropicon primus]|eukprot:QDZ20445.1 hypothetical protein A3770_04p29630 [Chloropicon primus]
MEGGSRSHRDQNDGSGSSQSQSGTRRGFRGTAENAKTKLCLRWQSPEGCRFGDRCNFAHGESELRKLPSRKQAQLAQQTASVNQQGGGAARQQQQQQQVHQPPPAQTVSIPRPPQSMSQVSGGPPAGHPVQMAQGQAQLHPPQPHGYMMQGQRPQAVSQVQPSGMFADIAGRPPPPQGHPAGAPVQQVGGAQHSNPQHLQGYAAAPHLQQHLQQQQQQQLVPGGHGGPMPPPMQGQVPQGSGQQPGSGYSNFPQSSGYSGMGSSWMNTVSWSQASQNQAGGAGVPPQQQRQQQQVPIPAPQQQQPSAWGGQHQVRMQGGQGVSQGSQMHPQHPQQQQMPAMHGGVAHHQKARLPGGQGQFTQGPPPGNWQNWAGAGGAGVAGGVPPEMSKQQAPQGPASQSAPGMNTNLWNFRVPEGSGAATSTVANSSSIWQNVYSGMPQQQQQQQQQQVQPPPGSVPPGAGGWAAQPGQGQQPAAPAQRPGAVMSSARPIVNQPSPIATTMGAPPMSQAQAGSHPSSPPPSTYAGAAASGLQQQSPPAQAVGQRVPGEWKEYVAPETGEKYYYNVRTGKTQWNEPAFF